MKKGYRHTEEAKAKIREAMLRRIAEQGHPRKGMRASMETREKMSLANRGDKSHRYHGGRRTLKNGYIDILVERGHPMARGDGYVLEHRLVMAAHLGRPLTRDEHVHHKNGVRDDNRIENLEIVSQARHMKMRAAQVTAATVEAVLELHEQGLTPSEIAVALTERNLKRLGI